MFDYLTPKYFFGFQITKTKNITTSQTKTPTNLHSVKTWGVRGCGESVRPGTGRRDERECRNDTNPNTLVGVLEVEQAGRKVTKER